MYCQKGHSFGPFDNTTNTLRNLIVLTTEIKSGLNVLFSSPVVKESNVCCVRGTHPNMIADEEFNKSGFKNYIYFLFFLGM